MSAQPRGMSKGRRWRAGFGYALVLATLVVPSGIVLYTAVRAADARDHVSTSYVLDASRAERLRSLGLELGLDVRALLIRSDPLSADAFRDAKQRFDQALLDLRANAGPEGRSLLVGIDTAADDYERAAERILTSPGARVLSFDEELLPRMNQLRDRLDAYVRYRGGLIEPARRRADAQFRRALRISSAAFLLAIGLSGMLATLTARTLERDYRREQQTAARAERALATRDEVLAVVAHDLRSPLSAIAMKAGILRRNPQGDKAVKQADAIERIAMRMEHLVRMLLDAASMDAGRFRIEPADVEGAALVRETLDQFAAQAESKAIQLQSQPTPLEADLKVRADRDRIVEVLSNLIDNAIKFAPRAGRVTVTLRADDDAVLFAVNDDGPGIAPENLPHVFDRFWKAEAGGKRGTGLGLFIAKGIVEAHGGRIWADSSPGQGGTFSFTLPRAPLTDQRMTQAASPEGPHATI